MKKWIATICRKGSSKYIDSLHLTAKSVTEVLNMAEKICEGKGLKNYWITITEKR